MDAPPGTVSLEQEARRVLPGIRSTFARVLSSLPGHVHRPRDLMNALGIHQTLAWKIVQVVDARDPFAGVQYIPGASGVEIFLSAAGRRGVPENVLARARAAMDEFKRLIEAHAGNRASLEIMLSGFAHEGRRQAELTYRKAGFQCNSHAWGVQARTQVRADFLHPGSQDESMHLATVMGFLGLRRMRPHTAWTLARRRLMDDDGQVLKGSVGEPIDPEGVQEGGLALLRPFCPEPLPEIRRVQCRDGVVEHQLAPGPVGDQAAVTYYTGDVLWDGAPRWADAHNRSAVNVLHVRTPVEVLLIDLFVHGDLFGSLLPELRVYGELSGVPWHAQDNARRLALPVTERVEYLGCGSSVVHTSDVPEYEDLIRFVFGKLGWDGERFDVYRVRMEYPMIPTAVVTQFELPERPCS